MCQHVLPCPPAHAPDREADRIIAGHPEQGWNLLCNGIVLLDDTGMLPDGTVIEPHRAADRTPADGRTLADGLLPDWARPRRGLPCRTGLPMREGRARPRSLPSPAVPATVCRLPRPTHSFQAFPLALPTTAGGEWSGDRTTSA